jgi:hypothetical protein
LEWGDFTDISFFVPNTPSSTKHHNNRQPLLVSVPPSTTATIMITGIDDLTRIFNLLSEADRGLFSELCTQKSLSVDREVSYDPSIVAALLVSTIKSLAATVNSFIKITNGAGKDNLEISADSVALRYVEYQRLMNLPSTLVEIFEQQCSGLVDRFEEETKVNLYRYFLSCCSMNEVNGGSATSTHYLAQFEKMLSHTLTSVCSNIQRNLEDLMDFDFLWDASIDNTLLFGGDSLVEGAAKELAWALSRTTCQSVLREDCTDVQSCERRYRILHEAACLDLVLAGMLTQLYPSNGEDPDAKRMRLERDPREVRQYLLNSIGELLKYAVPDEEIVIERSDLNVTAQQVATSILPFINDRKEMGSDEQSIPDFLCCISSHQQRQTCLIRLKERQRSIVIEKTTEILSSIPPHLPHTEKAVKLGWHVLRLQQRTYDHFHGFYQLDLSQRKMLAPFVFKRSGVESNGAYAYSANISQYDIQAILYMKHQDERITTPFTDRMNTIHISGWKEPPLSDTERDELQKWITYMSSGVAPACTLAPSHRLMVYLHASSLPPPSAQTDGNINTRALTWDMVALPVLNYCLSQAAKDFGTAGCFIISETGDHTVPCVTTHPDQMNMPSAILRLYYAALDIILHHDAAKRKSDANPSMVLNLRVHSSLFALCRFCLHKARHLSTGHRHNILMSTENQSLVIEDIGTCPIVYYKLIDSFIKALSPGSGYATSFYQGLILPSRMTQVLRRLQEMLLGLMWMRSCVEMTSDFESTFVGMINKLKQNPTAWKQACPIGSVKEADDTASNEKERIFVRYVLRNLVKVTRRRTRALCVHLSVSQTSAITSKTIMVFVNMLYHRVDMFIDRHPDQLMLCSLYLVCSKMKLAPTVDFQKIKDAYMEINESFYNSATLNTIFYEVKLTSSNDESGNILSFYNKVFAPNVRPFWKSFVGEAPNRVSVSS